MINTYNTLPIGFFDSGVGGLSVYARFKELLPNENTLYFGDLIHLPYGNKSKNELIGFARNILNFYKKMHVKAVIIACNTSSAQAYDTIKDEYNFKIYPIIQSCAKIIGEKYLKIGIFATESTVQAGTYTKELKKYNNNIEVRELARKNWVSIVEGTCLNLNEAVSNIQNEVQEMLEFNPEKIILGCTHYPYLMNELTKYAPAEIFIDPAIIFADYIRSDLMKHQLQNTNSQKGTERFFVSASPQEFVKNSKLFYCINNLPELVPDLSIN